MVGYRRAGLFSPAQRLYYSGQSSQSHSQSHAPPSAQPSVDSESEGEEEYVVRRIHAMRKFGRNAHALVTEFLVSWEGYGLDERTWEPYSRIVHTDAYKEFQLGTARFQSGHGTHLDCELKYGPPLRGFYNVRVWTFPSWQREDVGDVLDANIWDISESDVDSWWVDYHHMGMDISV